MGSFHQHFPPTSTREISLNQFRSILPGGSEEVKLETFRINESE